MHEEVREGCPTGLAVEFLQKVRIVELAQMAYLLHMRLPLCQAGRLKDRMLVVLPSDSCL